jgi:hypothetical protein
MSPNIGISMMSSSDNLKRRTNMRRNHLYLGIALVAAVALVTGCAKPPQEELDAARAAMANAEQSEAPTYAPEAWDRAQQAMNTLNAELEAQNAKFALFRSYTNAKQLTADAANAANEAQQAGAAAKEQAMNEARALLDELRSVAEAAQGYLADLQRCRRALNTKGFRHQLELVKGNLDGYLAHLGNLESQYAAGDYLGVRTQGGALKADLDQVATELLENKNRFRC